MAPKDDISHGEPEGSKAFLCRSLIEILPEPYAEQDLAGRIVYYNQAYRQEMGYGDEELPGLSYQAFMDRKNAEKAFALYHQVYRTGKPARSSDLVSVNKKGDIKNYEVTVSLIRDDLGIPCGFSSLYHDITERHAMEKALRRSEERLRNSERRYRSIFENAVLGIYQVTVDGRFLTANDRAARIIGYDSAEEMIQSVTDIGKQVYADEDKRRELSILLEEKGFIENFEVPCRHKAGRIVWLSLNVRVVRDECDGILYHEGTSQDITERKATEEALRSLQERMALALEGAELGMYDFDVPTGVGYVDDRYLAMLGYTGKDFPAFDVALWFALVHPEDQPRVRQTVLGILKGHKRMIEAEYRLRHASGPWVWVLTRGRIVQWDRRGNPLRFAGTHLNITARKEAETALQRTLNELEERVRLRTADLEEANTALRVLLKRQASEQRSLEAQVHRSMDELVRPIVDSLRHHVKDDQGAGYLDLLDNTLKEIASPFLGALSASYRSLTPKEILIASMIREGKNNKQMAHILGINSTTIEKHRNNIRKKLGLVRGKINLRTYLLSLLDHE